MLVLTRKPGETIIIQPALGGDLSTPIGALFTHGPIEVRVNHINKGQVKVGIMAHTNLTILRDELTPKQPAQLNPTVNKLGINTSRERIARHVYHLRKHHQWSVKQLARLSNLSVIRIYSIENCQLEISVTGLDKLAVVFGVDIVELF